MQIVETVPAVRQVVKAWKKEGLTVGFVPTMGYLHEGHASLVAAAKAQCDRVVVSIFVNPTQFGPNEDLDSYPRDPARDEALLNSLGVDLLFRPGVADMYDPSAMTMVAVPPMAQQLCGKTRTNHFQGVCTVVSKLFHIVAPDHAYFGQKDAQQLMIIQKMVRDLNFDLEVHGCPIIREPDGLAKSSRNTYLSAEERRAALVLSRAVFAGQKAVQAGNRNVSDVLALMQAELDAEPMAKVEYLAAVSTETCLPVTEMGQGKTLFAMAVVIGTTRLIDNFMEA